jgi:acylphosphatase
LTSDKRVFLKKMTQEKFKKQIIRAHLLISGRVQGVFYRASTQDKALSLDLHGWVCNLPNGQVEIVAQGKPENVHALIAWARSGPPMAQVDDVDVSWEEPSPTVKGFRVR